MGVARPLQPFQVNLNCFRFVLQSGPLILKTAVTTPLMLRYALLRKALSTNGVVTNMVWGPFALSPHGGRIEGFGIVQLRFLG